jgi:putative salt-induced outer membrane protein YdiY
LSSLGLLLVIATLATTPTSAQRRQDQLVMLNGDRFVGEIKELSQGELRFKTDYIRDTFNVDWAQVMELESQDLFRVEVRDGRRLTGTIARRADGSFTVVAPIGRAHAEGGTVAWSEVVAILPIERSFWAQLTGQINSGFSYTSGDSQSQFSASGNVGYVADRYAFNLTGNSSISRHVGDAATGTSRYTAELLNMFPFGNRWFAGGLVGLLRSDQQDLDLRTTAGTGVGRWLTPTQHIRTAVFGGLVYTHEKYLVSDASGAQVTENLEGVASVQFLFHRFKTVDIQSNATVYPSLSSAGRVRFGIAPTLNIEIVRNLYWNFTLYENYDSRPPVNANKNDFGVTNSIGWKF